jgi:hypothetical protein
VVIDIDKEIAQLEAALQEEAGGDIESDICSEDDTDSDVDETNSADDKTNSNDDCDNADASPEEMESDHNVNNEVDETNQYYQAAGIDLGDDPNSVSAFSLSPHAGV